MKQPKTDIYYTDTDLVLDIQDGKNFKQIYLPLSRLSKFQEEDIKNTYTYLDTDGASDYKYIFQDRP